MKTWLAIGLGLTLAIGNGLTGAQEPKANEEPRPKTKAAGLPDFREVFIRLDTNGDTIIERDEVLEAGRAAFERLLKRGDTNQDGKLQLEELRALGEKARVLVGLAVSGPRFQAADKDGDGKLSRAEFPGRPAMFDRIDADKDGFITRAEVARLSPAGTPAGPLPPRFRAMDKDGDGKLSQDEFTGPATRFERLDANDDGFLSRDELPRPASKKAKAKAQPDAGKPAEKS
jgi:Ca2+-binding EF-hand superfamily protein